jgi:putative ABC transport system permease protein
MSVRRFFFRKRSDEDLRREIEEHIELERYLNLERGLNEKEAARHALIKFGSRQRVREDIWRMNSATFFEKLLRDFSYAVRTLLRSPGFTALAVMTLALGIGANTAIFTVINGVLLRPLPYSNPSQIVHLEQTATRVGPDRIGFSVQEVQDYRQQSRSFSDLAEYHSMTFTLLGAKVPERVVTGVVSANYFRVLGVNPVLGRLIIQSDETMSAPPVLMLSYAYWVREFGADPKILGRPFTMNDRVHIVVGVLPPLPEFPDANDVYMPTTSCPFRSSQGMIANRDARVLTVLGRLKPGVTLTEAQADLNTIGNRLALSYPRSYPTAAGLAMKITPLQQELTHAARPTLLMLLGAAGLVLLLACANLANLALSRQLRRSRETAIRLASGATTWDIFRQLMVESITVALAGGVLGLGIAMTTLRVLVAYAARMTPLATDIHLDGHVLIFGFIVALVTGVLFGSIPGFIASRSRLSLLAGSGERTAGSEGGTRTRNLLVAVQVAFSFVLLVGAGLMMRSLYNLLSVDPGFKTTEVLSMNLPLNWTRYSDLKTQNTFFQQVLELAQQIPGARSVALSSIVPLNNTDGGMNGGVTPATGRSPAFDTRLLPCPRHLNAFRPNLYRVRHDRLRSRRHSQCADGATLLASSRPNRPAHLHGRRQDVDHRSRRRQQCASVRHQPRLQRRRLLSAGAGHLHGRPFASHSRPRRAHAPRKPDRRHHSSNRSAAADHRHPHPRSTTQRATGYSARYIDPPWNLCRCGALHHHRRCHRDPGPQRHPPH